LHKKKGNDDNDNATVAAGTSTNDANAADRAEENGEYISRLNRVSQQVKSLMELSADHDIGGDAMKVSDENLQSSEDEDNPLHHETEEHGDVDASGEEEEEDDDDDKSIGDEIVEEIASDFSGVATSTSTTSSASKPHSMVERSVSIKRMWRVHRSGSVKLSKREMRAQHRAAGKIQAIYRKHHVSNAFDRLVKWKRWYRNRCIMNAMKVLMCCAVLLLTLFLAYICLLYGLKFDTETSKEWLASSSLAFFLDIFINEPLGGLFYIIRKMAVNSVKYQGICPHFHCQYFQHMCKQRIKEKTFAAASVLGSPSNLLSPKRRGKRNSDTALMDAVDKYSGEEDATRVDIEMTQMSSSN
jgi:hypothetical protein